MKKEVFVQSTLSLPPGFAFLNGCSIPIDRTKILLIGGHHVRKEEESMNDYVVRYPPNNQVVVFDIEKKKWTFQQKVPISIVRKNKTEDFSPKALVLDTMRLSATSECQWLSSSKQN